MVSDNRGFYVAYVERKAGISNVMFQHSAATSGFTDGVLVNDHPGDGAVSVYGEFVLMPQLACGIDRDSVSANDTT